MTGRLDHGIILPMKTTANAPAIGETWETTDVMHDGRDVSGRAYTIGMREELVNGMVAEVCELRRLPEPIRKCNPWRGPMRKIVTSSVLTFTHTVIVKRVS